MSLRLISVCVSSGAVRLLVIAVAWYATCASARYLTPSETPTRPISGEEGSATLQRPDLRVRDWDDGDEMHCWRREQKQGQAESSNCGTVVLSCSDGIVRAGLRRLPLNLQEDRTQKPSKPALAS
jgi:hypothetical protein